MKSQKEESVIYQYNEEFNELNKLFRKQNVIFPENLDKLSYRQFPYMAIFKIEIYPCNVPLVHFNKDNQDYYQELTGFNISFDTIANIKVFCKKVIESKVLRKANHYEINHDFIRLYSLAVSTLYFIENIMPEYDEYLKAIQPVRKRKYKKRGKRK